MCRWVHSAPCTSEYPGGVGKAASRCASAMQINELIAQRGAQRIIQVRPLRGRPGGHGATGRSQRARPRSGPPGEVPAGAGAEHLEEKAREGGPPLGQTEAPGRGPGTPCRLFPGFVFALSYLRPHPEIKLAAR